MHTPENLEGAIERITFHSESSGYSVLKIKVAKQSELVTVVGTASQVRAGQFVKCQGFWCNDQKFGLQFKAQTLSLVEPNTLEGLEKYLASGLVRGVGPHFAKCLVQAFGKDVFTIIDANPNKLLQVPGLGQVRLKKIIDSWTEHKDIREIVVFLQEHGMGTARAIRIYKTYGKAAVAKVRENPYRLALDIHGIGFKTADLLAIQLGIGEHSILRAEAGVRHVLQEISNAGHCAASIEHLSESATKLLDIPASVIAEAIENEIQHKNIIAETIGQQHMLYLSALYYAELGLAKQINRLLQGTPVNTAKFKIDLNSKALNNFNQVELSLAQKEAAVLVLNNKLSILTGGPGVGKTTVVSCIIELIEQFTDKILLCAPTGRAAKRLFETTNLSAKTIHRLLEFDPSKNKFTRNETNYLDADWIIVDESSMIDLILMNQFLKAVPDTCCLIFVGDTDQLPSIGPGRVLANLIDSKCLPSVHLFEIFRQVASSKIIVNAHLVNQGRYLSLAAPNEKSDFYFIETEELETIQERVLNLVAKRIPAKFGFKPEDIQVLVPMSRGGLGARALNCELQKTLNPNASNSVTRFGLRFGVNDRVIQVVNNYDKEVFNGDIGFIRSIDLEDNQLIINFDGKDHLYEADELDELNLAYAITIHKSQGSEYPVVVMPISMQHYALLERNLIYTGLTRGKRLVVIIGQKKALNMAIRNSRADQRVTFLVNKLQAECHANKR